MEHLRDVMTTNVDYCSPEDNVYEVAVKMKQDNVGAIPICDNQQLLGMITDRDIVIRGVAEKKPNSTQVTEIMSEHLITATPDMSVSEAAKLMATKQIRRLPVVENNKLVGICSLGDLAVRESSDQQAGIALSEISEPTHVYH
ncbi:CBS domain-containing protein [Halalkalibacterium ligniniphilum]|uniref:CBS domain-containing protein n=1 Tax=Halalkalibacterium ligniniphilum TaxID=1134413 RepID=UPI000345C00C|nr:CBS domain-containing protein [Halalkalibacterium ligniniphilum]